MLVHTRHYKINVDGKNQVSSIGDICHSRLVSHIELSEKFQIHCTFLEALGLRMSIPASWREVITKDWKPETTPMGLEIQITEDAPPPPPTDIALLTAKKMYSQIIMKKTTYECSTDQVDRGRGRCLYTITAGMGGSFSQSLSDHPRN